jgi:aryl-alcohol dehydrogenase-like predicted oxidoreductase
VIAPDGSRASFDDRFERFYLSERGWEVLDAVREVAAELDATPAQVALAWLTEWDEFTCVPIVGARTADQLAENVAATDLALSDAQWDRIMDARYAPDGTLWGH